MGFVIVNIKKNHPATSSGITIKEEVMMQLKSKSSQKKQKFGI